MSTNTITVYRTRKSVLWVGFIILALILLLALSTLTQGTPIRTGQWVGLGGFVLMGIALTVLPLGFRLEIGEDYVKSYFLGFCVRDIHASTIQSVKYGNLFGFGGLGAGKGLRIWERTKSGKRYTSIGESAYGKEAIEHARRVLEANV